MRTQREVDALYDCLSLLHSSLTALGIPYLLIAGSLLGAVRSTSFLFSDDDADIAIFAEDYPRLLAHLPATLGGAAQYTVRPFPAADRVRPRACTQVWVDVFVLQRYDSLEALGAVLARRANGSAQAPAAVAAALAPLQAAPFPLWHYDNRLALELWPREYLTGAELFPLRQRPFGHLALPTPAHATPYLHRAYGQRCLHEWLLATQHGAFHKESAQRLAAAGAGAGGQPQPMQLGHYLPIHHSRHRPSSSASSSASSSGAGQLQAAAAAAAQLQSVLAEEALEAAWDGQPALHPTSWPASYPPPLPAAAAAASAAAGASSRLGVALAAATGSAPTPFVFTPALLAVLEPHVRKAREARAAGDTACAGLPAALRVQAAGQYSAAALPLAAALARALGVLPGCAAGEAGSSSSSSGGGGGEAALARLHELVGPAGKHAATARLRDASVRSEFAALFDAFVATVALPHLAAAAGSSSTSTSSCCARVQAFPCLRLIQPGEFSLGVHCDTFYGHPPTSLNLVLPLTPAGLQGCAGLCAESSPGQEDWHAVGEGGEGSFYRFHGGQCLHFTGENSTPWTRVSLDFRVLWGEGGGGEEEEEEEASSSSNKYVRGGYYSVWQCREGGVWERQGPQLQPHELFGYPFLGMKREGGK